MVDLRILLNSYHSGANAWFALGEERGHFEREGLTVELAAGSGAYRAPQTMVANGFDLAFGDMTALLSYVAGAETPGPAAVFMVHHTSPSAIATPKAGPIREPGDLAGRRLLTHASDVAFRSFPVYARAAGLDPARIDTAISDEPMAAMLQIMLGGGCDGVFGYVTSQVAVLRQIDPALAERLRFLPFSDVAPDLYGSAILAARSTLTSKREETRAFLRAMNASLLEAVAEPEAAVSAVLKRNGALDRAVELDRWRRTVVAEMAHPEILAQGFGAVDSQRLRRMSEALAATLPLTRAPSVEAAFDGGLLPQATDRSWLAAAILNA